MAAPDEHSNVTWTKKLEDHFAATGERAHCLSWGHKHAEELFSVRRTYIDLPVIVLSSVTGFLSVGQGIIFDGQDQLSSILLGVISLFVGALNTTGSYFGWAKRAEAHRISAIHYARLYRAVKTELSLPRDERMTPSQFLKYSKDQYERLAEISPMLPPIVVAEFKKKFSKYKSTVTFPEEMNGLEAIEVFDPEFEAAIRQGGEVKRKAEEEYRKHHMSLLASSSTESFDASESGSPIATMFNPMHMMQKAKKAKPASPVKSQVQIPNVGLDISRFPSIVVDNPAGVALAPAPAITLQPAKPQPDPPATTEGKDGE